ncbi:MAG: hypothetical protein IKW00_09505 [Clostridia bacterium]|nr:hypothetical protein [Clostridia bacterium]
MQIIINEGNDVPKIIRIPTGLLTNRISAFIAAHTAMKESGITARQLCTLMKAVKEYRKDHPEWALVEVGSEDSPSVRIII